MSVDAIVGAVWGIGGDIGTGSASHDSAGNSHFGAAAVGVAIAMGESTVLAVGRNNTVLAELVATFGPRVKPVLAEGKESDKNVYAAIERVDLILNMYPPGTPASNVAYALLALKSGGSLVLMGGVREDVSFPYLELMMRNING
jgi:alcohol dehydrogenase